MRCQINRNKRCWNLIEFSHPSPSSIYVAYIQSMQSVGFFHVWGPWLFGQCEWKLFGSVQTGRATSNMILVFLLLFFQSYGEAQQGNNEETGWASIFTFNGTIQVEKNKLLTTLPVLGREWRITFEVKYPYQILFPISHQSTFFHKDTIRIPVDKPLSLLHLASIVPLVLKQPQLRCKRGRGEQKVGEIYCTPRLGATALARAPSKRIKILN